MNCDSTIVAHLESKVTKLAGNSDRPLVKYKAWSFFNNLISLSSLINPLSLNFLF